MVPDASIERQECDVWAAVFDLDRHRLLRCDVPPPPHPPLPPPPPAEHPPLVRRRGRFPKQPGVIGDKTATIKYVSRKSVPTNACAFPQSPPQPTPPLRLRDQRVASHQRQRV